MCILRLSSLMAIVPLAVLLTVSFFVLFTIKKIDEKGLRAFGYVVAGFLWLAALVVFSSAVFGLGKGSMRMGQGAMMPPRMKMNCMSQMKQQNNPPSMGMSEKAPLVKDDKGSGTTKCAANKGIVYKAE